MHRYFFFCWTLYFKNVIYDRATYQNVMSDVERNGAVNDDLLE